MRKIVVLLCCFTYTILTAQTKLPSAQRIIDSACKEAAKQNKKALIIFHASWCGWCHKMDSSMNDITCRDYFLQNFVIAHVTVYETGDKQKLNNAGGEMILKKYHADKQGIPAWFILNKEGALLADSQMRQAGKAFDTEGINVGYPSNKPEVDHFINVLKQTTTLSVTNENAIRARFLKNGN
jgi:thiol-disulfide isomerase/thioredoxin